MMSDTSNDYKDIAHIYVPIQFRFCHYESVTKGRIYLLKVMVKILL